MKRQWQRLFSMRTPPSFPLWDMKRIPPLRTLYRICEPPPPLRRRSLRFSTICSLWMIWQAIPIASIKGWSVLFRKCVKGLRRRSFVFPSFTQGTFYRENSIEFWIWKVVFKGRWNYVFRKINRRFFLTGYSLSGWKESLQMPRTGWESIRFFPTR